MRAPGRTSEAVTYRTTPRRATLAAGAALLLVTSATVNTSTTTALPAHAAPAAAAPPGSTFALPNIAPEARRQRPASRAARVTVHRVRHRLKAATRHKPAARARHVRRATHHAHTTPRPAHRAPGAAGRLGSVAAFGYEQVGKPYEFGSSGPNSWDCSGLTEAAYAGIGVSLPHKASGQARRGTRIPRSVARPGDLVAWGSRHVGIYVGRGRVVHAPGRGRHVTVARIWGSPTFRRLT